MVKKKKISKILMPAIMLAVTAVLLIAYLALGNQAPSTGETDGSTSTDDVTVILQRNAGDVEGLSYTLRGEDTLSFSYDSTAASWTYLADPAYPLMSEYLDYMAAAISYIGVYRTLDSGDTGMYGFENPAVTITVEYTDGARYRFAIGDQNSMTGYHYFKDLDKGTVYTIDSSLLPYFQVSLADMFAFDSLNSDLEESYITSITWNLQGESGTLEELTEADQSLYYSAYQALAPTECADWSGTNDALAAYGIANDFVTIGYRRQVTSTDSSGNEVTARVAATYTIHFGTVTDDGKVPYILPSSHVIYLADYAKLEAAVLSLLE